MVGVHIVNAAINCKQEKELVKIIIFIRMKLLNVLEKKSKHGHAKSILKRVVQVLRILIRKATTSETNIIKTS